MSSLGDAADEEEEEEEGNSILLPDLQANLAELLLKSRGRACLLCMDD